LISPIRVASRQPLEGGGGKQGRAEAAGPSPRGGRPPARTPRHPPPPRQPPPRPPGRARPAARRRPAPPPPPRARPRDAAPPRPPAVPVAELLDALDRLATTPDGRPAREHIVVQHPLQTVDERNFTPGALGVPGAFSHDDAAYAGAVAARRERRAVGALVAAP